ncbi:MAG: S8/S53 family peptidase [Acidobacteria bacterium]|nr:S8/S53 family peptidase [Acidobacteriota bacterium]
MAHYGAYTPFRPSQPRHVAVQRRRPIDADVEGRVTVVFPPRMKAAERASVIDRLARQSPHEREYFSPGQHAEFCGANPDHLSDVETFGRQHGLKAAEISVARRCVVLSGAWGRISEAFRVLLFEYAGRTARYRSHPDPLYLPKKLHAIVEAILGLDARPVTKPLIAAAPALAKRPALPSEVAEIYKFPKASGEGECVAIVLPGGGFRKADMKAFFGRQGEPKIKVVEILGQKNNPAPSEDIALVRSVFEGKTAINLDNLQQFGSGLFTTETSLDVQLVGSFAGGARIVVYFCPDTTEGQFHALTTALTDKNRAGVISCSWSAHESELAQQAFQTMDTVFQTAVMRGVTICFSSGDDGDGSLWSKGKPLGVHFPSSSPHVLACGGTRFVATGRSVREEVWDERSANFRLASGGGFSKFARPSWQAGIHAGGRSGRGVPDVAGKADVHAGYEIIVDGQRFTMGGTSAATPMWASLITRINQKLGRRVGFINALLYSERFGKATNDVVVGNNGAFSAGPGWDACTGLGSPNGTELLKALSR